MQWNVKNVVFQNQENTSSRIGVFALIVEESKNRIGIKETQRNNENEVENINLSIKKRLRNIIQKEINGYGKTKKNILLPQIRSVGKKIKKNTILLVYNGERKIQLDGRYSYKKIMQGLEYRLFPLIQMAILNALVVVKKILGFLRLITLKTMVEKKGEKQKEGDMDFIHIYEKKDFLKMITKFFVSIVTVLVDPIYIALTIYRLKMMLFMAIYNLQKND